MQRLPLCFYLSFLKLVFVFSVLNKFLFLHLINGKVFKN